MRLVARFRFCGVGLGGEPMKAVAGAVVLFAGGAVAEAILTAAQRSGYSAGGILGMWAGVTVALVGLVLLGKGWGTDPDPDFARRLAAFVGSAPRPDERPPRGGAGS
jgi:hypothetical protein